MRTTKWLCVVLTLCFCNLSAASVHAESIFTVRRTFGALFVGGSAVLAKRALYFRSDANEIYDRYLVAASSEEAEALFKRTSDRDTKSQMAAGLSVVLLVSGLRLLLASGRDDNLPKMDRGLPIHRDLTVNLNSNVYAKQLGVALNRQF